MIKVTYKCDRFCFERHGQAEREVAFHLLGHKTLLGRYNVYYSKNQLLLYLNHSIQQEEFLFRN